jgi:excisionase family DNA binding protein
MNAGRYVRLKEACQYGRIGQTKMYELINAGKIDAYKDGRTTKVGLDSVERYNATLPKYVPGSKRPGKKSKVKKHEP